MPIDPRISRRTAEMTDEIDEHTLKNEKPNNKALDSAVGYMRWLARPALCSGKPQTP